MVVPQSTMALSRLLKEQKMDQTEDFNVFSAIFWQHTFIFVTLRLGRPSIILITAGSSNICPLPRAALCPLLLPRCLEEAHGKYCSFCRGGDGALRGDRGLGCGGGGVAGGGGGGEGGASPNWRLLLDFSVVPFASKSRHAGREQRETDVETLLSDRLTG